MNIPHTPSSLDDTLNSCYNNRISLRRYIAGEYKPNYPIPMHRNRDIDSPLYHWYLVGTVQFYLAFHR